MITEGMTNVQDPKSVSSFFYSKNLYDIKVMIYWYLFHNVTQLHETSVTLPISLLNKLTFTRYIRRP